MKITGDYTNKAMSYPNDSKELDEFYKKWYIENKEKIGNSWVRPEVYSFASEYAKYKAKK